MPDLFRAARLLARERESGGEDAFPLLPRLDSARGEGFPGAHVLDVVEDGDGRVACEHEVAVHAVDGEVWWDGELRRGEALGYDGAAVDAAGAGGVPEGAGVGEDVLVEEGGLAGLWFGDGRGRKGAGREKQRTGPMAVNAVNSNTFSIADFLGSRDLGLTSVALLPFSLSPMLNVTSTARRCLVGLGY